MMQCYNIATRKSNFSVVFCLKCIFVIDVAVKQLTSRSFLKCGVSAVTMAGLPEDSPHGRSPQKIRHKEDLPHNECDREFERNRRTNVCNSADVEDSQHNGDRLGGLGGVGLGG